MKFVVPVIVRHRQAAENLTRIGHCPEKARLAILIERVVGPEDLAHVHFERRHPLGCVLIELKGKIDEGLFISAFFGRNLNNFHALAFFFDGYLAES
jgi:hypothetical protein